MTSSKQLELGAFMRTVSIHTAAWRHPGAWSDANFNFSHLKGLAQRREAAKFDAFFMADHLAFGLNEHMAHDERYVRVREFFDVVTGLWDSWADDAFIRDAESGPSSAPRRPSPIRCKSGY